MKFISICSGIEAASVAFEPLGWKAIAFSEIEPFPCAVLAHHYPDIPNFGDMANFKSWPEEIFANADVIVGGPPCQAFSVAGLRNGIDDARGNLTLIYAELINHADAIRIQHGKPPVIVLYENVPGLLSDKTNAFGRFLAGLAGEDLPLEPPGGKWANAGVVLGPQRAIAWRVTDAQYFGVPQRRRRVFVVASARDGFDPAEILFEFDGVRRDIAPSREKREEIAGTLASRTSGGFPGTDEACSGYIRALAFGGNNTSGPIDVATARNACSTASGRMDFESETFLVHGTQDPCISDNAAFALGRNSGQENILAFKGAGQDGRPVAVADAIVNRMQIRRITPVECERLQGFPDNYTNIPIRGKPAADGPRYKALGNSWAIPNVRWIGQRIHNGIK